MGQWLSCAVFFSASSSAAAPVAFSNHSASLPFKHHSLHPHKTPAAHAINRRHAALGTESTLVDSATQHSTTAFPLSTTTQHHDSSHISISPPPHHHRRYLSTTTTACSTAPFSASASASASPPAAGLICSPPPQLGHVRSSSASSCSSSVGCSGDVYGAMMMTRTSSHVDVIEEIVEPTPSPPSPSYTPAQQPQPARSTQDKPSSRKEQPVDDVEETMGEVRSATLSPLLPTPLLLSPRSVLAFMIVSNGGECETADETDWEDEVEEMEDDEDEDDDGDAAMDGVSMRDILASLPKTSTTYISPFPASNTMPSYASLPSLPSASSLRPTTRHSTNSLSYPSLTALAARTTVTATRQPQPPPQSQRHQRAFAQRVAASAEEEDKVEEECGEDEGTVGVWYEGSRVVVPTRSARIVQQPQWTTVATGV